MADDFDLEAVLRHVHSGRRPEPVERVAVFLPASRRAERREPRGKTERQIPEPLPLRCKDYEVALVKRIEETRQLGHAVRRELAETIRVAEQNLPQVAWELLEGSNACPIHGLGCRWQTYREKEPDRIEKRIALADHRIKAGKELHGGVDEHEVLARLRKELWEL